MHRLSIVFILLLLAGCATAPTPRQGPSSLEPGIYATATGERLSPDELYARLARYRFVAIGEQHDDRFDHAIESRVFDALGERVEVAALGMEMFQRPFQDALDAYVAGEIGEAEMLARTEYGGRWGMDTAFYAPLWRSAHQQGFAIVALNASRELSHRIAEVGLDGLSAAERQKLPEMDLDNPEHRAYVRRAFEQHDMKMTEERFERFYAAQVLWDETMAETATNFMQAHPQVDTMVIVAGGAHADKRFGIPPRIERRLDARDEAVTLMPVDVGRSDGAVPTMEELRRSADYIWVGGGET